MQVALTVIEIEGKDGFLRTIDDSFRAVATLEQGGHTLNGIGEHEEQNVAEALALADLKAEYRAAFPPQKTVVTKALDIDTSEW